MPVVKITDEAWAVLEDFLKSEYTNVTDVSEVIIGMHGFILELIDELVKTPAGKAYMEKGIKVVK